VQQPLETSIDHPGPLHLGFNRLWIRTAYISRPKSALSTHTILSKSSHHLLSVQNSIVPMLFLCTAGLLKLDRSNPAPEPASLICFHRQSNALTLLSFWIFTVHWKILLYFTARNSPSIVLCVTVHGSHCSFSPASTPYGLSPVVVKLNSLDFFHNFLKQGEFGGISSLYKITGVRLKPFMLPLWAFLPKTVGARTLSDLHGTKTLDALTTSANVLHSHDRRTKCGH
jgi:hypothetical protein